MYTCDRFKYHRDADYSVSGKREIYHLGVFDSLIDGC